MTLYIKSTTDGTHHRCQLVTASGCPVATVYDGGSQAQKFAAIRYWRGQGFEGWCDPCAISTSGGNGNSRYLGNIGRWDRIESLGKVVR